MPQSNPEIPKIVGPYKIEYLLEKGGMSVLYLATHQVTKDPTTIKLLSSILKSNPEAVARFLNEAEIIALTDHPNIVRLYGQGEWEGGPYIAMEFIQGISLRQLIIESPISLKKAIEIIIDIGNALCHLHSHGVIHRDLKPENILITETGQVKVIDFGIAQLLSEQVKETLQAKHRLIGTPIYMSPEQQKNPGAVSYPSDIYSLGIIAYELILGKLSRGHIHLSLMPKGIKKILIKALQPKPEDRFQDVVEFINDLSEYYHSGSVEKEKKVGDQLSELSENLRDAQQMLSPPKLFDSPLVDLGLAVQKMTGMHGIYYEAFPISNESLGIVIGESSLKGAEGILATAILRGMVHALHSLTDQPKIFMEELESLLLKEKIKQSITLSYLFLSSKSNTLTYHTLGNSLLYSLPANSKTPQPILSLPHEPPEGNEAKAKEITIPWEIGDTVLIYSDSPSLVKDSSRYLKFQDLLSKTIEENEDMPSQKLVDTILRKIIVAKIKPSQEHPLVIIAICRKQ